MSAIKKNPIFFTLIIVASVLSMSGLYFAYDASGQLAEAQKKCEDWFAAKKPTTILAGTFN